VIVIPETYLMMVIPETYLIAPSVFANIYCIKSVDI
jgi:hypothetical protein